MSTVTIDIVKNTKKYLSDEKYKNLTIYEIATLCGTSKTTVARIRDGEYDFMLKKNEIITNIPYEEFKHLQICEVIVKEMLNKTIPHSSIKGLAISPAVFTDILKTHLPEVVNDRLTELKMEEKNG